MPNHDPRQGDDCLDGPEKKNEDSGHLFILRGCDMVGNVCGRIEGGR
jgi:hypothetical protein